MKINQIIIATYAFLSIAACTPRLASISAPRINWPSYKDQIPVDEKIVTEYWTTVVTSLANGQYRQRTFYPEKKQCTQMLTVTDKNFHTKDGAFKEWWDDGFKKTEGQYKNDKRVGQWKSYSFDTGELLQESEYINGDLTGIQKNYSRHGLSSSYTFAEGIKNGPFMVYDSTDLVVNEGLYKADTIFEQSKIVETKIITGTEKMPQFPGCLTSDDEEKNKACAQRKMLEYIYSNIKYPADARENGLEGTSIIRFVVGKDGQLTDIVAVRGLCRSIENECLGLVKSMPTWEPGTQDGKPVKVQFNLPIRFKLQ